MSDEKFAGSSIIEASDADWTSGGVGHVMGWHGFGDGDHCPVGKQVKVKLSGCAQYPWLQESRTETGHKNLESFNVPKSCFSSSSGHLTSESCERKRT